MSARSEIAALLQGPLQTAGVRLIPYSRDIDLPETNTVMIRLDRVIPAAARGLTTYEFSLILIAAKQTAPAADDELEELLEDVLLALDKRSDAGITWSSATRATYKENPAFDVAIAATVTKS